MNRRNLHSTSARATCIPCWYLFVVVGGMFASSVFAHGLDVGTAAARITKERFSAVIAYPIQAFLHFDDNLDGSLSREEVQRHRAELQDGFMTQAQVVVVETNRLLALAFFDVGVPTNLHAGHEPYLRVSVAFDGPIEENGVRLKFDFSKSETLSFRVNDERTAEHELHHFTLSSSDWSPALGERRRQEPAGGGSTGLVFWDRWGSVCAGLLAVLIFLLWLMRSQRRESAYSGS